ncbi:MAG TPA: patatin-like phospholipase family protein [Solirubrobacteraceae bacterium]|nr:patatin-like phospholipase family protein [Solirubrobacteraceae bacterium]
MATLPDILVLGGGGRQADAWLTGVLAGLEDTGDLQLQNCEYFVGTSAGAVVAARLATGERLERPASRVGGAISGVGGPASGEQSPLPNWAASSAMAIAAPLARLGLGLGILPGEIARATALRFVPASTVEALDFRASFPPRRTRFDGRLRAVAVDRNTGRRVVFGAPGAPRAKVAEAVAASCAIPLVFAPVTISGSEYVDGAVWSPTNADVAPVDREAQVLILNPTGSYFGPLSLPIRAASRAAMLLEASALIGRGARVRIITPDRISAASIGSELMSVARLEQTLAAGYSQGLAL